MKIRDNLYGPDYFDNDISFEQVIADNESKILNLIYGMTGDYHLAQDLTQETFIKAFKSLNSFNGTSKVSTWLYRIAVNLTIDYKRKRCVQTEKVQDEMETGIADTKNTSDPDTQCQKKAVKDILFEAIAKLPEQHREVFVLREINGCSTKEVAEILGVTAEVVKWRLHKARSILRKTLKGNNQYKNLGTVNLNESGLE